MNILPATTLVRLIPEGYTGMVIGYDEEEGCYEVMDEDKCFWQRTDAQIRVISLPYVQVCIDEAYRRYGSHSPQHTALCMLKLAYSFGTEAQCTSYIQYCIANAKENGADVSILEDALAGALVFKRA